MNYEAKIKSFELRENDPMVHSDLYLWVVLKKTNEEIHFIEKDSIENLRCKFEFKILGMHSYDFTGFTGKECIISEEEDGYHFISFK
jgi:hypothetical protein